MEFAFVAAIVLCAAVWLVAKYAAPRIVLGQMAPETPKPGEQWAFIGEKKGPWPAKEYAPVNVKDVQGGWVRYEMQMFSDERLPLDQFRRMYRRVGA